MNPEDVENSAWHYLCNARANTPKKAREDLIPVSKDTRVPMKQVLELFAGKLKPQDVLDAAENAKLKGEALTEARFYANQYVALYYESEGDAKKARTPHDGAEKYKIGHYMGTSATHTFGFKRRKSNHADTEEEKMKRIHQNFLSDLSILSFGILSGGLLLVRRTRAQSPH